MTEEQKPMIVTEDGQQFWGGLLMPETRPMTMVSYAEAGMPMLDDAAVRKLVNYPGRKARRLVFPSNKFIRRQINNGCNGFAGAGALTRARIIAGLSPVMLSGDGLYCQINGGRDGGSHLQAGMDHMQREGIPPDDMVKLGTWRERELSAEAREAQGRFKGFECYRVDTEQELVSGAAIGFVGVVAVHVGGQYSQLDRKGRRGISRGPGNHAVGVQDLREGDEGWEFDEVGSWGTSNGDGGYAWLTWQRHLRWTVQNHAFYLVRAASDDPQGIKPPVIR